MNSIGRLFDADGQPFTGSTAVRVLRLWPASKRRQNMSGDEDRSLT